MFDDNKLPVVGMLCKHKSVNKLVIAPLDFNNKIVLISIDNGIYSLAHCDDIEPIDSRTDTKKFVDDIATFNKKELAWTHTSLSSAIKAGKIHAVKWVGE